MISVTANELKRGGVSVLKQAMQKSGEHRVTIDVRGKPEFVVLDIEQYNAFREYEFDEAIKEAETDYANEHYDVVDDFDKLAEELQQVAVEVERPDSCL
jgi:prevent-host-death family protein